MTDHLLVKQMLLPLDAVDPNPWNPNRQSAREFEAVIESLISNGWVAPILVRQVDDRWQVIDGEHRLTALQQLVESGEAAGEVAGLVESRLVPANVIDVSDAQAMKLTIIMNETRGTADRADLGALLSQLQPELGDDLILGLPYTGAELEALVALGDFDWDALSGGADDDEFDAEDGDAEPEDEYHTVTLKLDDATWALWERAMDARDAKPTNPVEGGIALYQLLLLSQ